MMYTARQLGPIVTSTFFVSLAGIIIALRFYVRGRIVRTIGIEDWLALATFVSLV